MIGAREERTMQVRLLIVAVMSVLLSITSTSATVLIKGDNGGMMENYTARFRKVRNSGESVVIDGKCLSACTMVLGLVPRDRICATPNAVLGFHAAWEFDYGGDRITSASGTRELMKSYPSDVRAWIARQGGLTANMMFLRGRDLAAIVTPCDKAPRAASVSSMRRVDNVHQVLPGDAHRATFGKR